ncbi:MAG: DUF6090 family protein [Algoriphagus sp.]|jgi:hypothetical protein|uniref:DUF6090 family protein n=1 Tax=Algoriphagus sp. TaxID=1872435 RepID=UPI00263858BB|nr:DUF6090 family protein [Algoriphagus sp.]MDG1278544.1 DUF6090 family protein [Algoriphagus sp.]
MIKFFRKIRLQLIEGKNVGKYFQYAIGEIILVVIGILIALQLNNWNVEQGNKKKLKNNVEILIENLQRDSSQIVRDQRRMERDRLILDDYEKRVTDPQANLDTLIKIASKEYSPTVNTIEFTNKSAYTTMVQSGEINLFDKELLQEIYAVYSFQARTEMGSGNAYEIYMYAVNEYRNSYTFKTDVDVVSSGPLYDQIWEDIDPADFIAKFNSMAAGKRLNYSQTENGLIRVSEVINDLLPKLRELIKED